MDKSPKWYLLFDLALKLLAMAGVVVMFFVVTRPAAEIDLARKTLEANKDSKPLLSIKPTISQPPSFKGVRRLQVHAQLANKGLTDVAIKAIRVNVFRGTISAEAQDVVSRTQIIADSLEIINSPTPAPIPIDPTVILGEDKVVQPSKDEETAKQRAKERATKEYEQLRLKCLHGQVFLISEKSADIEWKALENIRELRNVDTVLRPEQTVSEHFDYLLTETLDPHYQWLRFVIEVNPDESTYQRFEYIVPTRQGPEMDVDNRYRPTYKVVKETSTVTGHRRLESSDEGWLIPRGHDAQPKMQ